MKRRPLFATLCLVAAVSMPALGQSRSERVNNIASALSSGINDKAPDDTVYTDARTGEVIRATPAQLMRETLTSVDFKEMSGRLALEIWSNQTNVPLVVNWRALEAQGIDPNAPVTLRLGKVPAEQVLKLIIQQIHPDPLANDELLLDIQQWYVRIITKEDALRRSTTKLYFIGDLLMDIPNFDNAPGFDLNAALSNTNSGGSGGNSGGGAGRGGGNQGGGLFFADDNDDKGEERLTKQEKAERIADMIRNTIEPDIWRGNGGEYGSVRYYRGMLIVKAPEFVHEQIGGATGANINKKTTTKRSSTKRSSNSSSKSAPQGQRSSSGNVAGVAPKSPKIPR
ncbi:MAG: hypothetical protein AB8C95_00815 [Phycisphaeraceae bacterium]